MTTTAFPKSKHSTIKIIYKTKGKERKLQKVVRQLYLLLTTKIDKLQSLNKLPLTKTLVEDLYTLPETNYPAVFV